MVSLFLPYIILYTWLINFTLYYFIQDKPAADLLLEECTYIPIDNLMEMLTFCVETTYFGMGSDIYWKKEGLAMGSPLSQVLTNIYLENFKKMALRSTSQKLLMWLWYIDDIFILYPHQEDFQTLLDHANSIQPSIQFTIEKEQDNQLTFLDVLLTHSEQ